MTQPQVTSQARVQIHENMTVGTVKKYGSDGQKLMAPLFDRNHDGKFDEKEAKIFNSYNFNVEDGKITLKRNAGKSNEEITEIIYDNFEKDVLHMHNGTPLNNLESFVFTNDKGKYCRFSKIANYTKAIIDMIKGTVKVENAKGHSISGNNIELTIKNSDLETVHIKSGELNLQNVKDEGLIWDSETEVETDDKSIVNADEDSKIRVKGNE